MLWKFKSAQNFIIEFHNDILHYSSATGYYGVNDIHLSMVRKCFSCLAGKKINNLFQRTMTQHINYLSNWAGCVSN